jgi:hypothetical protein
MAVMHQTLWNEWTTDLRVPPNEVGSKTDFQSTRELLLYPLVKNGRAEAPDPADLQSTNLPAPRHPLERLRMDFQDRCRLV